MDPIIHLLIAIAAIGLIAYCLGRFIPMPEPFDKIVIGVAVILTILYALRVLGVFAL